MEDKNKKSVDVNNSDETFVNGVLYGLMHAIEMVRNDKITLCKEGNKLASLINANLDSAWGKLFESFSLVRKHGRVPNFQNMLKELNENEGFKKNRKDEAKALDRMWELLLMGEVKDENK